MHYRRLRFFVRALLLAALAAPPAVTRADSATDVIADLVDHVDANQEQAFTLLERAVNINSGTLNAAGVREVGDLFRTEFETLGFRTEWVDGAPFGRAGHLLAHRGNRGPRILLIGHLDTVFEADSPFQKFARDGDIARGPGASDMKGGIVVILTALRALASVDALNSLRLTVVLTGDEEEAGAPQELARAALIEAARESDVALGFENADDDPATAVTARRGTSSWTLNVTAPSAHSSQIFRAGTGAGAIFETARILQAFHTQLGGEEYLTFNPGLILGGTQVEFNPEQLSGRAAGKGNIIAPAAVVIGDLRAISEEQRDRAQARMQEIVAAHLPQAEAEITFEDGYPPLAPTDGNRKLLGLYDQASRDLGFGPVTAVDPRDAGAADISFVGGIVPMALDGLGLLGGDNHTENEFADLRTFRIQAQRLALLLYRLGATGVTTTRNFIQLVKRDDSSKEFAPAFPEAELILNARYGGDGWRKYGAGGFIKLSDELYLLSEGGPSRSAGLYIVSLNPPKSEHIAWGEQTVLTEFTGAQGETILLLRSVGFRRGYGWERISALVSKPDSQPIIENLITAESDMESGDCGNAPVAPDTGEPRQPAVAGDISEIEIHDINADGFPDVTATVDKIDCKTGQMGGGVRNFLYRDGAYVDGE